MLGYIVNYLMKIIAESQQSGTVIKHLFAIIKLKCSVAGGGPYSRTLLH